MTLNIKDTQKLHKTLKPDCDCHLCKPTDLRKLVSGCGDCVDGYCTMNCYPMRGKHPMEYHQTKDTITLRNEGPNTLIVELNGKQIIREHFASGESEINHNVNI